MIIIHDNINNNDNNNDHNTLQDNIIQYWNIIIAQSILDNLVFITQLRMCEVY